MDQQDLEALMENVFSKLHDEQETSDNTTEIKFEGAKFQVIYPKKYEGGGHFSDSIIKDLRSAYEARYKKSLEIEEIETESQLPNFEFHPISKGLFTSDKPFDKHDIGLQVRGVAFAAVVQRNLKGSAEFIKEIIEIYRKHLAEFLSHNPDAQTDD